MTSSRRTWSRQPCCGSARRSTASSTASTKPLLQVDVSVGRNHCSSKPCDRPKHTDYAGDCTRRGQRAPRPLLSSVRPRRRAAQAMLANVVHHTTRRSDTRLRHLGTGRVTLITGAVREQVEPANRRFVPHAGRSNEICGRTARMVCQVNVASTYDRDAFAVAAVVREPCRRLAGRRRATPASHRRCARGRIALENETTARPRTR